MELIEFINKEKKSNKTWLKKYRIDSQQETAELREALIAFSNSYKDLIEAKSGLEEIELFLNIIDLSKEERIKFIKISNTGYGLEDLDETVEKIKKALKATIKFLAKLVERVIKFITSFFNKGLTLTEKVFIAAIVRKRDNLERVINDRNLGKNEPLALNKSTVRKILRRKDLFLLLGLKNGNKIDPDLTINFVNGTIKLFIDNLATFDNTTGSLTNITRDVQNTSVTRNSFIGFVSEKNKTVINNLKPMRTIFNNNDLLKKVVEIGMKRESKEGFETFIMPLPIKGRDQNKVAYVAVNVRKYEEVAKMDYNDIKSVEDLLYSKEDYIDYKELGINPDEIEKIEVVPASFNDIDRIVENYREASTKIKKKLNGKKLTSRLEKFQRKLIKVNIEENDSKVYNYKLTLINTLTKFAVVIIESSNELYRSAYCESIKDYILGHEVKK